MFKRLIQNIGFFSEKATPTEFGINYGGVDKKDEGRQAVYPDWFFTALRGQPRGVDLKEIRQLSRSPWVQMVLNSFKKQIYSLEWDIVKEDEEDETDRTEDILKVKNFLYKINKNNDTINDINSETITDIAEIDAGVWNLVYSSNSYEINNLPTYDSYGNIVGTEPGLKLKPLGQREIVAVKSVDGASILKQTDIYKNLLRYYQYSFKHPRNNPTPFEPEEIVYFCMNKRPYSVYGFSPVQAIQQVLDLLIQGTRYNKDLYHNNAIPDMLVSLPKLPADQLDKLKRTWLNKYKNKPHQIGFINWAVDKIHKLVENNRDLEWLDGQKWYFKLVFAVFGVSPTEAGFFENSNKSNDEGQERVTVRNALRPYMLMLEQKISCKIITEILQNENHNLKFKFFIKDSTKEKNEFEQNIKMLELGVMTINEIRTLQGKDPVEWGDEPLRRPFNIDSFTNFADNNNNNLNQTNPNLNNISEEKFKKSFERFMDGKLKINPE